MSPFWGHDPSAFRAQLQTTARTRNARRAHAECAPRGEFVCIGVFLHVICAQLIRAFKQLRASGARCKTRYHNVNPFWGHGPSAFRASLQTAARTRNARRAGSLFALVCSCTWYARTAYMSVQASASHYPCVHLHQCGYAQQRRALHTRHLPRGARVDMTVARSRMRPLVRRGLRTRRSRCSSRKRCCYGLARATARPASCN